VLDLQELEAVLEHMETLQTMRESLREQQFQAILELGVELQDILQAIKKLHNADILPEGNLATPMKSVGTPQIASLTPQETANNRIPQNPRKLRKKQKQISPQSSH
jgi:hypothetical protein